MKESEIGRPRTRAIKLKNRVPSRLHNSGRNLHKTHSRFLGNSSRRPGITKRSPTTATEIMHQHYPHPDSREPPMRRLERPAKALWNDVVVLEKFEQKRSSSAGNCEHCKANVWRERAFRTNLQADPKFEGFVRFSDKFSRPTCSESLMWSLELVKVCSSPSGIAMLGGKLMAMSVWTVCSRTWRSRVAANSLAAAPRPPRSRSMPPTPAAAPALTTDSIWKISPFLPLERTWKIGASDFYKGFNSIQKVFLKTKSLINWYFRFSY